MRAGSPAAAAVYDRRFYVAILDFLCKALPTGEYAGSFRLALHVLQP